MALVVTALCYTTWPLGFWLNPGISTLHGFASELAAGDQPWSWVFRLGDTSAGVLALAGAIVAARAVSDRVARAGYVLLAVFGVATVADASAPLDCAVSQSAACRAAQRAGTLSLSHQAHEVTSSVAIVSVCGGVALVLWAARRTVDRALVGGGLVLAGLAAATQLVVGIQSLLGSFTLVGLTQRAGLLAISALVAGCGVLLPRLTRLPAPPGPEAAPPPTSVP